MERSMQPSYTDVSPLAAVRGVLPEAQTLLHGPVRYLLVAGEPGRRLVGMPRGLLALDRQR